jgi:hypothetical protein
METQPRSAQIQSDESHEVDSKVQIRGPHIIASDLPSSHQVITLANTQRTQADVYHGEACHQI